MLEPKSTFERHYRLGELAAQWAMGRETCRKLFQHEPGVVKVQLGRKKSNAAYYIPESVAERVHTRLLNAA